MKRRRRPWHLGVWYLSLLSCTADSRTVLHVINWAGWEEQHLEDAYVHRFEDGHAGVRVSLSSASNQSEYRDQILTSIAARTPPDVFLLDNIDIPAFVRSGVLLDIAPYAARVGLTPERFAPQVLDIFRQRGAWWAFPKGYTPMVIAYNKDLFDRARLPYPKDDWTWEEFRAAARALTRDSDGDGAADQWGFWLDRRPFMWIASLWSLGGDVLCPDGARASGCLDSPATIRAFTLLTGIAVTDGATPRFYGLRRSLGDGIRNFYSGRVAMVPAGHFWVPNLVPHVRAGRLRMGFVLLPHLPGVAPVTVIYASGFAVPRNAPHRRLSVELAAYMADSVAQETRARGGLEIPALASVAAAMAAADTLGWEAVFARAALTGRAAWGARIERWREVEAVLPDIMDRIVINREDPAAVLHDVARRLDRVLAAGPR